MDAQLPHTSPRQVFESRLSQFTEHLPGELRDHATKAWRVYRWLYRDPAEQALKTSLALLAERRRTLGESGFLGGLSR